MTPMFIISLTYHYEFQQQSRLTTLSRAGCFNLYLIYRRIHVAAQDC